MRRWPERLLASCLLELGFLVEWPLRPVAVALYALIERGFASSPDLHMQRTGARAMLCAAFDLGNLRRGEQAVATCQRLVERFGRSPDPRLRSLVAWAEVNRGWFLHELGRDREAVVVYRSFLRRSAGSPEVAAAHARGLRNLSVALAELGRASEALAARGRWARLTSESPDSGAAAPPASSSSLARVAAIIGAVAITALISSVISFAAYRQLVLGHSLWLLAPVLYVDHVEHSRPLPGLTQAATRFVFLPLLAVPGGLVVQGVRNASWALRVAAGVLLGGELGNAVDYTFVGSVTDFVGIRTSGIWSAGDLCMCLGMLAMLAISAANPGSEAAGASRRAPVFVLSAGTAAAALSRSGTWLEIIGLCWATFLVASLGALARSRARRGSR